MIERKMLIDRGAVGHRYASILRIAMGIAMPLHPPACRMHLKLQEAKHCAPIVMTLSLSMTLSTQHV